METRIKPYRSVNFSDLNMEVQLTDLNMEVQLTDQVREVVDRLTGETYFLTEFHSLSSDSAEISREIEIMKKLDHPNLVKCLEVFEIRDKIYLLLEHMDYGSLSTDYITSESSLASVARQVLSGLSYLHQNGIWHGDIGLSNIFVDSMEEVKILYLGETLSGSRMALTEIEAIHDVFSWDVWSLGLNILKLSEGLNWMYVGTNFGEEIPKPLRNEGVLVQKPSIELWRFLLCCMQTETDASNRWTTDKLLRHPFFYQLSAGQLKEKRKFSVAHASRSVASDVASEVTEITLSYEAEQSSFKTKRPKVSVEGEQGIDDGESPEVPTIDFGKCIQHCALFLPDSEFEEDKLVQMWIAEECIKLEATKRMEDVANLYFDALLRQEIIIPSMFGRQMKYKVNTSKAANWFLERGNYIRIDVGNVDMISGEALHLQCHCKRLDDTLVDALQNFKQLRTLLLLVDRSTSFMQLPNSIFFGLKLVRTLDLSCSYISEVPDSIGLLESLRFLDISETPIKQLPESTDRLQFLQTLRLKGCFALSALPKGFGCLINLRHLDLNIVSQLEFMPRGMGNLIKLQTLRAFIVGKNDGCRIGELKNMNEITGSFSILRLENVSSAEEAKEAALGDKQCIDKLDLRWQDVESDDLRDTADILECLQPHFHLKELQIAFYGGSKLPSWINNPSFTDLSTILLFKCINCDILPSIGELPSLKILRIVGMTNVRDINTLFCRNYKTQGFNAFPKLEKLTLENMANLVEWTGIEDGDFPCLSRISIAYCQKLSVLPSISHLCSLQYLEINHCMQLMSLPELPGSLESLIIRACPKVSERCTKDGRQEIAYIKNIWIDFEMLSLE